jgi:hypothetical protein
MDERIPTSGARFEHVRLQAAVARPDEDEPFLWPSVLCNALNTMSDIYEHDFDLAPLPHVYTPMAIPRYCLADTV